MEEEKLLTTLFNYKEFFLFENVALYGQAVLNTLKIIFVSTTLRNQKYLFI
jgi:hypothetical protein